MGSSLFGSTNDARLLPKNLEKRRSAKGPGVASGIASAVEYFGGGAKLAAAAVAAEAQYIEEVAVAAAAADDSGR